MGLRDAIALNGARYAHALVVEVPGSWRMRMAAERTLAARGWRLAVSPADADVLVVCGEPGPTLAKAVEVVWHQMPGPRVRVDIHEVREVDARLEEAHTGLLDTGIHRIDAQQRPAASELLAEQAGPGAEGGSHGGMDHGGHEGHGDMEMSPGGIPLAEGGEDRDGLEMDVLQVRFGPVLSHWPAGLVLRCSLQGDVIVEAQAQLVDGSVRQDDDDVGPARSIDNIASLLALAGWDDAAAEARRIRDTALEPGDGPALSELERLRRRVRRSWTLRWSLRGLRRLSEAGAHSWGLSADAVGDTYDRLIGMVDRAVAGVTEAAATGIDTRTQRTPRTLPADHLPHLVMGLDLATARLVLASLDIHQLLAAQTEHDESHG